LAEECERRSCFEEARKKARYSDALLRRLLHTAYKERNAFILFSHSPSRALLSPLRFWSFMSSDACAMELIDTEAQDGDSAAPSAINCGLSMLFDAKLRYLIVVPSISLGESFQVAQAPHPTPRSIALARQNLATSTSINWFLIPQFSPPDLEIRKPKIHRVGSAPCSPRLVLG